MTTVVNVRDVNMDDPDVVYIGRRMHRHPCAKVKAGSLFGNPHRLVDYDDRASCIADYERTMRNNLKEPYINAPFWRDRIMALDGKRLACWCAPKACHGDVLVRLIDELKGQA